ncbi:MAG: hypothetical protein JSW43_02670 [Gemmatimonadota bacterium]|nr:MAG: hypothetical protein JSW43_02670 [Gemmatimonadota bacterium]
MTGPPEEPPRSRTPRLGPWLRSYGKGEQESRRERTVTTLVGGAAAVAFLAVLLGVLWLFVRYPLPTLGGLVAVWGVGLSILLVKRQRARLRDELRRRSLLRPERRE